MVRRDAPAGHLAEGVVVERVEVCVGEAPGAVLHEHPDASGLLGGGQADALPEAPCGSVVATLAAEHEVDGGKQPFVSQALHGVGAPRRPPACPPARTPFTRPAAPVAPGRVAGFVEGGSAWVGPTVHEHRHEPVLLGVAVPHQVEQVELDRSAVFDDGAGRTPERLDPTAQLRGIRHRCREAGEADRGGSVDQHLLPHRTPVGIGDEVHLVEDHPAESLEGCGSGIQHVAQHLGGHDDHRGVGVDHPVPGHEAHLPGAQGGTQVAELLVGEGLDRGRVEGAPVGLQGPGDGMFAHDRLSGTGRRRHEHVLPVVDGLHRLALEAVQGERMVERGPHCSWAWGLCPACSRLVRRLSIRRPMRMLSS